MLLLSTRTIIERTMSPLLLLLLLLLSPQSCSSIGLLGTTETGYDAGGPDPVCWEGYSSQITDGASLVLSGIFGLNDTSASSSPQPLPNPLVSNFSLGRLDVQSNCPEGVKLKVQVQQEEEELPAATTTTPRTFTEYHYTVEGRIDLGEILSPGSMITTDRGTSELGIKVRS